MSSAWSNLLIASPIADSVGATDAPDASIVYGSTAPSDWSDTLIAAPIAESVGASDTASTDYSVWSSVLIGAPVAESVGASDVADALTSGDEGTTEPIGMVDAISVAKVLDRAVSDVIGILDASVPVANPANVTSDDASIGDEVTFEFFMEREPAADTLGLVDGVSYVMDAAHEPADTVGIGDSLLVEFTGTEWYFSPPSESARVQLRGFSGAPSSHLPMWQKMTQAASRSIVKTDGFYTEVSGLTGAQIEAAEKVYLGGRSYRINEDEKNELVAAGYGAGVTANA